MSAALLCSHCFAPFAADDLTQTIVLGDEVKSCGALCLQTAEVHVDCNDPRGEFVYDCRRRFYMTERNNRAADRDEAELDEGKGPAEGEASREGLDELAGAREDLKRDRDADREEEVASSR